VALPPPPPQFVVHTVFTPLQEVRTKSTPERRSSEKALDFIQVPQGKIEHRSYKQDGEKSPETL
jgi:hypothetical protein